MTTDIGDREIKVQEAIKLVKQMHLDRYGFEDCNEVTFAACLTIILT